MEQKDIERIRGYLAGMSDADDFLYRAYHRDVPDKLCKLEWEGKLEHIESEYKSALQAARSHREESEKEALEDVKGLLNTLHRAWGDLAQLHDILQHNINLRCKPVDPPKPTLADAEKREVAYCLEQERRGWPKSSNYL